MICIRACTDLRRQIVFLAWYVTIYTKLFFFVSAASDQFVLLEVLPTNSLMVTSLDTDSASDWFEPKTTCQF